MAYCTNCGRQSDSKICDNCGERNNRYHKYCYWCGSPFLGPTSKCLECGERVRISLWDILKTILFVLWCFLCWDAIWSMADMKQYVSAFTILLSGLVFLPALGRWIRKITYGSESKVWDRRAANMVRLFLGAGLFLLAFYFDVCSHEWVDASCAEPRHCIFCGETEGQPLGHRWKDGTCAKPQVCMVCYTTGEKTQNHEWNKATCTSPLQCRHCGKTKGNPKAHSRGEGISKLDILSSKMVTEYKCTMCKTVLETMETPVTSFVQEERFAFSPEYFMRRMQNLADAAGLDFSYVFPRTGTDLRVDFTLKEEDGEIEGFLSFYKESSVNVEVSERYESGLWCINLTAIGPAGKMGLNIDGDLLQLLYMSCDPSLGDAEYSTFAAMKMVTALNAAECELPVGYYEKNGLLYEFMYHTMGIASADSILVYPKDWR